MTKNEFQGIIEFAIAREKEAAKFYLNLMGKAGNPASRTFLQELAEMEMEHERQLTNFLNNNSFEYFKAEKTADMQLGETLEPAPIAGDLSYQDIITIAIKNEHNAMNAYANLAQACDDIATRNILLKLSEEEASHKNMLEKLYDDEILREN